jgi:hypothetical protein
MLGAKQEGADLEAGSQEAELCPIAPIQAGSHDQAGGKEATAVFPSNLAQTC